MAGAVDTDHRLTQWRPVLGGPCWFSTSNCQTRPRSRLAPRFGGVNKLPGNLLLVFMVGKGALDNRIWRDKIIIVMLFGIGTVPYAPRWQTPQLSSIRGSGKKYIARKVWSRRDRSRKCRELTNLYMQTPYLIPTVYAIMISCQMPYLYSLCSHYKVHT
jgi:hypothetical protein